jgi:hypothetical protein
VSCQFQDLDRRRNIGLNTRWDGAWQDMLASFVKVVFNYYMRKRRKKWRGKEVD